jgi:AraC-like DNA-binding protein
MTALRIKNMVCARCIKTVLGIFEQNGIQPVAVELGLVRLDNPLTPDKEQSIRSSLKAEGFEWLDNEKAQVAAGIKQAIIELVHYGELDEMKQRLCDYLAGKFHKDYHYLSNLFSTVENTTIEQFFILQKIERVKEWLVYDEFTLSEIAFKLGYSSVAHLSGQFKKVTGFTPTQFKNLKVHNRRPLDSI